MTHSSPSVNRITRSSILTNTPGDGVMKGADSNVVESCNAMVMRRVLPDSSERTCDLRYWLYDENNTTTPCDDTLLNDVNNDTTPGKVNADLCVGTVTGSVLCFPDDSTDERGTDMRNTQCRVKPVYALENVNVSKCNPGMGNRQDADALPLTVDRRVSCEALRSNGCTNNMRSVARVAEALRLPDGNDMRVADALRLPEGTAVMRDAVALHLPVTLKGTVTQNNVLRIPMNDVMSASPVSCVSSGGKGPDQPVYQKISQQARTSDSDINTCVSSAGTSQCMHGKRFIK